MNYKKMIELAKEIGIEEIEIIVKKTESKEIELFDRNVDKNVTSSLERCSIRGAYNGKLANVATENLSEASCREVLELLKDDKIQSEELNNPLNDAMKARDLFFDEVNEFQALSSKMKWIFCQMEIAAREALNEKCQR